jgi:hypothetical protein
MRHAFGSAIFGVISAWVVPWPLAMAQQPTQTGSLEQKLRIQYPQGTALIAQKPGILGVSPGCPKFAVAAYKGGQLIPPGKMQETELKALLCSTRGFPMAWRVNMESLVVSPKSGKVSLRVQECDACNSPARGASFKAQVDFDFANHTLDTTDPGKVLDAISQVFSIDTTPRPPVPAQAPTVPSPTNPTPAPPTPVQTPQAPPALGTVYVSAQNGANRLVLNNDHTFLLQEDGQAYTGTYSVSGSTLKVHLAQLDKDVDIAIDGAKLIVNGNETWTQPDQ